MSDDEDTFAWLGISGVDDITHRLPPVSPGEFRIIVASTDGPLVPQTVKAHDLRAALRAAIDIPVKDWFPDAGEGSADGPQQEV